MGRYGQAFKDRRGPQSGARRHHHSRTHRRAKNRRGRMTQVTTTLTCSGRSASILPLAPVDGTMRLDEGDPFLNGRSSSAWTNYADALLL